MIDPLFPKMEDEMQKKAYYIKLNVLNFLVLLLVISLTSCYVDGKTDQDTVNVSAICASSGEASLELMFLPTEMRENPQWGYINDKIIYLGRTAADIILNTDLLVRSKWIDQNSEALALYDDYYYYCLLFSDKIWDDNSHCVAVSASSVLLHNEQEQMTVEEMEKVYGETYVWNKGNGERDSYFQYIFDDNIETRFFSDSEGMFMYGDYLVKYYDVENMVGNMIISYKVTELLPKELRSATDWIKFNEYAHYIGKTYNEIEEDFPNIALSSDQLTFEYVDQFTGIRFIINDSHCINIIIPIVLLFENIQNDYISREELQEYWGISHTWETQYCPIYSYNFDDVSVFIDSDKSGRISKDSFVVLQESTSLRSFLENNTPVE